MHGRCAIKAGEMFLAPLPTHQRVRNNKIIWNVVINLIINYKMSLIGTLPSDMFTKATSQWHNRLSIKTFCTEFNGERENGINRLVFSYFFFISFFVFWKQKPTPTAFAGKIRNRQRESNKLWSFAAAADTTKTCVNILSLENRDASPLKCE